MEWFVPGSKVFGFLSPGMQSDTGFRLEDFNIASEVFGYLFRM